MNEDHLGPVGTAAVAVLFGLPAFIAGHITIGIVRAVEIFRDRNASA